VVSALYDSAQPCPRRTPSGTGSGQAVPPERPLRVVVGDVWGAARGAWPLRVVVGDGRAGPSPTGRTLLRIAPAIGLEPITCRLTAGRSAVELRGIAGVPGLYGPRSEEARVGEEGE